MFKSRLKIAKAGWLMAVLLILVGISAACSSGTGEVNTRTTTTASDALPGMPRNGLIQTSEGGGVTINVEWEGVKDGSLVLGVAMDTHSGTLDDYNLAELAVLRDDSGREYRPSRWDSPSGGHHRKGLLAFETGSLNLQTATYVELVLKDVAGVKERDLKWELG